jgi:hypothetical protein
MHERVPLRLQSELVLYPEMVFLQDDMGNHVLPLATAPVRLALPTVTSALMMSPHRETTPPRQRESQRLK